MAGLLHEARRIMGDIDSRRRANRPGRTGGQARTERVAPAPRVPATTSPPAPAATALRVPAITAWFWIIKALSTALGESSSDYLVHAIDPVVAVFLGFLGFAGALTLQLSMRRYVAWAYWFAVVMVGIFGTMAADVLHVGFHVPYVASAVLYALVLTTVFVTWQRTEGTLSIHRIDSTRRELFYWAAVVSTFALGTAVGDLTAVTLGLGYLGSAVLFAAVIGAIAIAYRLGLDPILSFWAAYVVTRPLGASVADWLGKPTSAGGLGVGDGAVTLALAGAIAVLVGYLAVTGADVQPSADGDVGLAMRTGVR
jgi:uncharacterized membrane-anchored protein